MTASDAIEEDKDEDEAPTRAKVSYSLSSTRIVNDAGPTRQDDVRQQEEEVVVSFPHLCAPVISLLSLLVLTVSCNPICIQTKYEIM